MKMRNKERYRDLMFKLILMILPVLFFAIVEIGLRLAHYGFEYRLFQYSENKQYLVSNPEVSKRFFNNIDDARLGQQQFIPVEKSANEFRIVILGGSSAVGFPYPTQVSFPRLLEYALKRTYSNRQIRVINLAITAVNSYAFESFAREILQIQPDVVLIYAGHNEYYGAMGVGSSQGIAGNRMIRKLVISSKKLKIVQLTLNISHRIKQWFGPKVKDKKGFMHRMAREQEIMLGSDLFERGIHQFRKNMEETISRFSKNGIPVLISEVVSNEKDQQPFMSVLSPGIDSTILAAYLQKAKVAIAHHNREKAISFLKSASRYDSTYAQVQYLLGECYYKEGDFSQARKYYDKARQYDALRFRAPEQINGQIRELAGKNRNVTLVETESVFRSNATHGIFDKTLFIDHLHPTIKGNILIAKSFYETLLNLNLLNRHKRVFSGWNQYDLPITVVDSLYGDWVCKVMRMQWPFYENVVFDADSVESYPENVTKKLFTGNIDRPRAMDLLYSWYTGMHNLSGALQVLRSVDMEPDSDWKTSAAAASMCYRLGRMEDAVYYYKQAFKKQPGEELARQLVLCFVQKGYEEEAMQYLDYILEIDRNDRVSKVLLQRIREALNWKTVLDHNSKSEEALIGLSQYYLYVRNYEAADSLIRQLTDYYPNNPKSKELKTRIKNRKQGES